MDIGLHYWQTGGQNRSAGVRICMDVLFISSAEITGDSQDMFEVSRNRGIPAVCIKVWLKVGELISTEQFHPLCSRGEAEQTDYHEQEEQPICVLPYVVHLILSSLCASDVPHGISPENVVFACVAKNCRS